MAHAMASRPTTLARPGVASSAALRASVRASRVGAFGRFVSTTTTAESGAIRREVLDRAGRAKLNAADDRGWYQVPRMCTHVDDAFLAQLTQLYRERVPPVAASSTCAAAGSPTCPPRWSTRRWSATA